MKPADYQRLRDVFLAAREREGAARQTWLLEICGDDDEMLTEVSPTSIDKHSMAPSVSRR